MLLPPENFVPIELDTKPAETGHWYTWEMRQIAWELVKVPGNRKSWYQQNLARPRPSLSGVAFLPIPCPWRSAPKSNRCASRPYFRWKLLNRQGRAARSVCPCQALFASLRIRLGVGYHSRKNHMRSWSLPATLLACSLASSVNAGYINPLTEETVREAYFFGSSTDSAKVMAFLAQYVSRPEPAYNGRPGVGEIEFQTPYEQVVRRSFEHRTTGYSAQQAQRDYVSQPQFIVRTFLFPVNSARGATDLYSDSQGRIRDRRENFWREFKFHVFQERQIEPRRVTGTPVYSQRGRGLQGAEISLAFDASEFSPKETRVEVTVPDGTTVVSKFALDQLK